MKAKHTPGPWRVTAIPAGNSPTIMLNGSFGVDLVDCTGNDATANPADVRLMASAPDLLAALDKIAAVAHGSLASGFTDKAARLAVLSIAADAIARATGAAS